MNKPIFLLSSTILLGMTTLLMHAQTPIPHASFATWKDNRKAAYTIIHDDFGDVTTAGIAKYADTLAFQRGIKFAFGAITSSCDTQDWKDAKRLIAHGHEIINHSHSHRCAVNTGWCTDVYGKADYPLELDSSTVLIERGSGHRPRFFIHPYDLHTDSILAHLKFLKYLGARSGQYSQMNKVDLTDFFRLNFFVFQPNSTLAEMNLTVDNVIAEGVYALRELHGVEDWSWGKVTLADYKAHLDYVQNKIGSKQLWATTLSEVATYIMQRMAYHPVTQFDRLENKLTVRFDSLKGFDTLVLKTPVTVNIVLDGLKYDSTLVVLQNGVPITDWSYGKDSLIVNLYPHKGDLNIFGKFKTCEPNCPPPPCKPNGQLLDAVWTNITLDYWQISDFTKDTRFPNSPTRIDTLKNTPFFRDDLGDMYGEKVQGYLVPKETGVYTFTLTSDDDSELYLGLNHLPETKRKVAGFNGYTSPNEFTKFAGQLSAPILLDSGKYYYVELLHLATTGHNPFRVYWQTPSNNNRTLIDKSFLSSKICNDSVPAPLTQQSVSNTTKLQVTGWIDNQQVVLDWVGTEGMAQDYFVVEKLNVNGTFEPIQVINGETHAHKKAWFRHRDLHPNKGDNIYQIRLVYQNGKSKMSNIVNLKLDDLGDFRLYPNPASHQVHLDLTPWIGEAATILVYNATGMVLKQLNINEITTEPYLMDTAQWTSGQYLIRVLPTHGRERVKKLTIFKE